MRFFCLDKVLFKNRSFSMKKLLLCSLALLITSSSYCDDESEDAPKKLTAKDIAEHAQFWVKKLPKLSTEEMELLANYLYFQSLTTHYECVSRATISAFHTASIHFNKQLSINEEEAIKIATNTMAQLKDLKEEFLPARSYATKSCKACLDTIEKSDFTTLKKLLVGYQQYCTALITEFIKQDKKTIEKVFEGCKKNLEVHLKKMGECDSTLQKIIDHENPYLKEGMNPDVADLDVAFASADACMGCMNEITLACTAVRSLSIDMLNISALTNRLFYQTFYETTKKDKKIDIMFNQDGIIDEDERSEKLPAFEANKKISINKKHLTA